ncbi:hypothetical protein PG988_015436 [Apiospora saccharicola]
MDFLSINYRTQCRGRIAAPRVGNRISMVYSTVGFEKAIEGLRELNSDLGRLRQQASGPIKKGTYVLWARRLSDNSQGLKGLAPGFDGWLVQ